MNTKEIASKLRKILNREDIDTDGLIKRGRSSKHTDDLEVLLGHLAILVADLRLDAEASKRELSIARSLLEESL